MANYTALERPSEITKEPLDVYLKITLRSIIDLVCSKTRIIASLLIGKVFGVLQAHLPLVLDGGTVLLSVPLLICTGFVYCHWTGRWAVLDNTHSKDSGVFCWELWYSHYHGPYFNLQSTCIITFISVFPALMNFDQIDCIQNNDCSVILNSVFFCVLCIFQLFSCCRSDRDQTLLIILQLYDFFVNSAGLLWTKNIWN